MPVAQTGYASIEDYEVRTGQDVPSDQEDTVQTWLNDGSTLAKLYMGDCAEAVEAAYPDMLASIVVGRVNRQFQQPYGLSQASVGSTSVSFGKGTAETSWLGTSDTDLLDAMMTQVCGDAPRGSSFSVGQVGAAWGGPPDEDVDTLWIVAGPAVFP
jgi:hypothetical protein